MNKRYIDFVPSKKQTHSVATHQVTRTTVTTSVRTAPARPASDATPDATLAPSASHRPLAPGHALDIAKRRPATSGHTSGAPLRRNAARGPVSAAAHVRTSDVTPRRTAKPRRRTPTPEERVATPEELVLDQANLQKPISEFTDLEQLAQEITEVTDPARESAVRAATMSVEATSSNQSFSLKQTPRYGVVENFQPKFVQTEVEKRPLSQKRVVAEAVAALSDDTLLEAKSTKITTSFSSLVENPVENSARTSGTTKTTLASGANKTALASGAAARRATPGTTPPSQMNLPHAQFINQNKVAKRPLSKNVYQRAPETPKTEAAKAGDSVKIVSEPQKSHKAGMFFAIIATILLGAVVGTVAFLLLPR